MSEGIDHLSRERIWSESVYADCVALDGKTGYMLRLCRFPDQDTSWLWAWYFTPERIYGFNNHYLPCPGQRSIVENPDLTYEQAGDPYAVFHRQGPRNNPQGASVVVQVMAHEGLIAPQDPGSNSMEIEARMSSYTPPWRINPYRSEWIGEVEGEIKVAGKGINIRGLGHWHEQHQKAPRFQTPFIYFTLRGRNLCLIGTITETERLGHVVRFSRVEKIIDMEITQPGAKRQIFVKLNGGEVLEGTIFTQHNYSTPIYDHHRPGTLVTAQFGEELLSGCVNTWQMENTSFSDA